MPTQILIAKGVSLQSLTLYREIKFEDEFTTLKLDPINAPGTSYSYTLRNGPGFLLSVAYVSSEWQLTMQDGQNLTNPTA